MDGQTNSAKAKPLLDAYLTIIVQHLVAQTDWRLLYAHKPVDFNCRQSQGWLLEIIFFY